MIIHWGVVIPVKRLQLAKTRLTPPPDVAPGAYREGLALAFALDVVAMAHDCACVSDVLVVTDDPEAAAAARLAGARTIADQPDAGLNPALSYAARAIHAALGVAAVSADLPAVRSRDLQAALLAAADVRRGFVSDAAGTGTTVLTAAPGVDLEPAFGSRSRAAHLCSGAVSLDDAVSARLRRDVDTEVDLWDAVRLGVGRHTAHRLDLLRRFPATCRVQRSDGGGTVVFDDATELPFDASAVRSGRLRHLRGGQRLEALVAMGFDGARTRVLALGLSSLPAV